jgi:O-antigen/teichoic acid export membrane protein
MGLIFIGTVVQGTLIGGHFQRRLFTIAAYGLVCNLALNFALIPPFSYVGAAAATTVTEALLIVLSIREARRRLDVRWPVKRLPAVLGAAAATVVVLAVGYLVNPYLQFAAGLAVYAGSIAALGALTRSDVRAFLPGYRAGEAT